MGLLALSHADIRRLHAQSASVLDLRPRWDGQPLGRMTRDFMSVRTEPSTEADVVVELKKDDVIRVRRTVQGEPFMPHNDLWLETRSGYVYSSFVQPVRYHLPNPPVSNLGAGRWAELTVPYSDAYRHPGGEATPGNEVISRMAYGCTFRVIELIEGADGLSWYRVQELYQQVYMRATHLRLIPDAELAPIHPEVSPAEKWIDIATQEQVLTCYEGDTPVARIQVSSGRRGKGTPHGTYHIFDKRVSERMVSAGVIDDDDPNTYNLAGVPFACYFTGNWIAVHGCYWHNDFGQPRSAGCVNLPPDLARWVWRWASPLAADLDALVVRPPDSGSGTRVVVRA